MSRAYVTLVCAVGGRRRECFQGVQELRIVAGLYLIGCHRTFGFR